MLICISVFVMMVISIYQYSWFLFAYNLVEELNWNIAKVSITFTVFTYAATFIQPFSGMIADSFGPKRVAFLASILVGLGLIFASFASSPWELYLFYGSGGLGVGMLYGISTAGAIKWFPDKRGLSTGLVVFGFGAGTAIFNWLIQGLLETEGFRTTFVSLGVSMLCVLLPCSWFYKYPPDEWSSSLSGIEKSTVRRSADYTPLKMFRTYQWYLIYFSFSFTVSIVLMFGAQMKMLAKEFNMPQHYFNLLLVFFPLANGLSRIFAGAVSDRIGREITMMIFYSLAGLSIIALIYFGRNPLIFLIVVFIAALLAGSPFALYPATIGDYYGQKFSTANYGITYTAKAWAGLISGWLSGYLVIELGSYKLPLIIIGVCSLLAAGFSNPRFLKAPSQKLHG
jgi:OFA family oxalate/formate antiporter-like MFS transporter